MAVPANASFNFVVQDNRGYRSNVSVKTWFADISTSTGTLGAIWTDTAGIVTALTAMTNAKIVRAGFSFDADHAQEPSSETGTYQLVIQKAKLRGGDGNGGSEAVEIPAPKDALFLSSGTDNLIVVNPAATGITGFQTSLAGLGTTRGGVPFSQFFGGQLVQGKPRRRRVVQGA